MHYRREVDLLSKNSLRLEETMLSHLLEWAGNEPFEKSSSIRPVFPDYMLTANRDKNSKILSPIYIRKVIRAAHNFYKWLTTHRRGFGVVSQAWLDTLKTPRMTIEYREHEAVTLEEIMAIAKASVFTYRDRRIRAAAVFWFLSGIRVGAFVTLPIMAVDIENLTIKQWPKLGVHTKFKKHATTYLLNIPELLDVVRDWDIEIRNVLPNNGFWFAPASPDTGELDPQILKVGENRYQRPSKDLRQWLKKVDLTYHSPHKFRHGHAVYALKNSKDILALKAVSQNLMHSNISITDGVYGILSRIDVREQITNIGEKEDMKVIRNNEVLVTLIEQLLQKL